MVVTKRLPDRSDSIDSNSDCYEILPHTGHTLLSSSPLKRKMQLMKKKKKKKKTTLVSSEASKMIWSKTQELVILGGIVDYQNEKKLSYGADWAAFYRYIKNTVGANFKKEQLISKLKYMKKKFRDNQARSSDGKGPSFTNTDDDDEVSKLSMIIWGDNETECASNENMDQAKSKVLVSDKDVPCVELERVSNITMEIDNGEKEKSEEEDCVDWFSVLQEALEEATMFQSFRRNQQKLLLQNLKNLEAERRKELTGEWKALLAEEVQLEIKKQTFSAKLANAGASV